jgi:hypothetical protein
MKHAESTAESGITIGDNSHSGLWRSHKEEWSSSVNTRALSLCLSIQIEERYMNVFCGKP